MRKLIFSLTLIFGVWWGSGCASTPALNQDGIKSNYYKDMMDYLVVFEIKEPDLMEVPEFPDLRAKPPYF